MRWPIDVGAIVAALLFATPTQATIIADPELLDETAYPVGSIINDAFEGLTLSSEGSPYPHYTFPGNVVRYAHRGAVVTHTLGYDTIYNLVSPVHKTEDIWGGTFWGRLLLRVDLDQPASSVFADIISFGASTDIMQITAYDATGTELGKRYSQDFPYGLPATRVEYSSPEATIAAFTVTDYLPFPFGFVIDKVGVTTPPQPGDFNGDGACNGADLLAWQRGDSPNPLSQSDLDAWETNYGAVPSPVAATQSTIPEPSTLLLLVVSALIVIWLPVEMSTERGNRRAGESRSGRGHVTNTDSNAFK